MRTYYVFSVYVCYMCMCVKKCDNITRFITPQLAQIKINTKIAIYGFVICLIIYLFTVIAQQFTHTLLFNNLFIKRRISGVGS